MASHTSPQRRRDELRFPVRIRIRVPPGGLGLMLADALRWLDTELGPGQWANWPTESAHGNATAFHFRTIEDAARFYAAFPMFMLADATAAGLV